jgi:hypothetical protein
MHVPALSLLALSGLFVVCLATTSCRDSAVSKQVPIGTFSMGEKGQVGPLIYTVFDTKWALSLGEQPTPRIPTHRFYIINVSAVNTASTPYSVPTFALVDDDGQTYQEVDNGEGVPNWLGFARRIQPADSTQGTIVFDVPQKTFKLRVADEEDHFAFIKIPLSLGEAPPDISIKAPPR